MSFLINDVLPLIINNLPLSSIKNFTQTCKFINDIVNNIDWKDYFIYNVVNNVKDLYKDIVIDLEFMKCRGYYLLKVTDPKLVLQHLNYYINVREICKEALNYKKRNNENTSIIIRSNDIITHNIMINRLFTYYTIYYDLNLPNKKETYVDNLYDYLESLLITIPISTIRLVTDHYYDIIIDYPLKS